MILLGNAKNNTDAKNDIVVKLDTGPNLVILEDFELIICRSKGQAISCTVLIQMSCTYSCNQFNLRWWRCFCTSTHLRLVSFRSCRIHFVVPKHFLTVISVTWCSTLICAVYSKKSWNSGAPAHLLLLLLMALIPGSLARRRCSLLSNSNLASGAMKRFQSPAVCFQTPVNTAFWLPLLHFPPEFLQMFTCQYYCKIPSIVTRFG